MPSDATDMTVPAPQLGSPLGPDASSEMPADIEDPAVGQIEFGMMGRLSPIGKAFGFDRGKSIDRYYIEKFLERHTDDIQGHVLEVGDSTYTIRFGGERVIHGDVLHSTEGNRKATIVGDLTQSELFEAERYDCIILAQSLQHVYDFQTAARTLYSILRPGGVVLCTVPGISQINRYDMDRCGEYWRFTTLSVQRLFTEFFPADSVRVQAFGNVFAAVAFLHGLCVEELGDGMDIHDPDYQLLIAVRAVKPQ